MDEAFAGTVVLLGRPTGINGPPVILREVMQPTVLSVKEAVAEEDAAGWDVTHVDPPGPAEPITLKAYLAGLAKL